MITSQTATQLIKDSSFLHLNNMEEAILFHNSLKRVLAIDIHSIYDQPPFNRVMMDGVAICYNEQIGSQSFIIEGIQAAGQKQTFLKNQSNCIEVMTGAPLPHGCDTVIPYEHLQIDNDKVQIFDCNKIKMGQYIHFQGSDYKKDQLLIEKNTIIKSGHISVLASSGISNIKVKQHSKIAILSSGDELVEPGNVLLSHQIYRSNPYSIQAILSEYGIVANTIDHLEDNKEMMFSRLEKILFDHELIIISGGVSKGKFDFLPSVLTDLGVKTIFHRVNQKPGKPLFFGIGPKNQLVFGLPGNPVSSMVNLRKYIISAIFNNFNPSMYVNTLEEININSDMTTYLPSKITFTEEGKIMAVPLTNNGSGDFFSLRDSDGFIEINKSNNNKNLFPFYHWKY